MSIVLDIVDVSDNEDDCILESVTIVNQKEIDKNKFGYIYKEKPLLAEFIEKCYDIENSKGMSTVINKTLIKYYNETNKTFKISSDFEKVLKTSIGMLETDPKKIYTHIKQLCDILASSSVRRRIKPTTLSTNIEDPKIVRNGVLKRKNSSDNLYKASKVYIIEVDKIDEFNAEDQPINNNVEKRNTIVESEKENNSVNDISSEEDNELLVPQKVIEIGEIRDPLDVEKVKKLEKEIARCKTVISKLDEQEVDDDSVNSPYIKSEKLKAKIVLLYNQLCNLTGNQAVKKRKINLRVIEGHPEGPVRRLESFLNNNIGPDGVPPFPDFGDVVECVGEANGQDNLGWTKHQILQEARALFVQCGRALQRRRQQREWLDLLHKVRPQRCDEDPADNDPALMKRLEENRRAAVKKESEILDRYSMMQTVPHPHPHPHPHLTASQQLQNDVPDESEDRRPDGSMSSEENSPSHLDISHHLPEDNRSQTEASGSEEDNQSKGSNEMNEIKIKKEPEDEIEERLGELGDNYTLTVREIDEDPLFIMEISDSSDDEGS